MEIGSDRARPDRATMAAVVAATLMPAALALIFFYVPSDADQGYSQRIFYFHVPIAMTTYALFAWGAINAARYLWTRDESLDLRSYVPMHLGVIFGTLTLITGSLWAHASWGRWWYWSSTELNTFLIILLFY
ncbi:MAG: cytochrome c biogenesis protein CcsA [Gaiellales bacterium]